MTQEYFARERDMKISGITKKSSGKGAVQFGGCCVKNFGEPTAEQAAGLFARDVLTHAAVTVSRLE